MNVKPVSGHEYRRCLKSEIEFLDKSILFKNYDLLMNNGVRTLDNVQAFLVTKSEHLYNTILYPIIAEAILRSEIKVAGSGEMCLKIIIEKLKDSAGEILHRRPSDIISDIKKESDILAKKIFDHTEKIKRDEYFSFLESNIKNEDIKNLIKEAVLLAGSSHKISVERTNIQNSVIEKKDSYVFNINTGLHLCSSSDRWTRKNCNLIIIDGIIESVGEIHHLLEKASSNNEPYIIFTRDALEDVKSTIFLNNSRKTIDVCLICVGMKEDTLNILNDISIITGSHLISSLSGDLISSACKEDLIKINKVCVREDFFEIDCMPSDLISSHIVYLNRKRDITNEPKLISLIDKRIQSLSAGKVTIKVGDKISRSDYHTIEKIDKFFRISRAILRYGFFNRDRLDNLKIKKYTSHSRSDIISSASLSCAILTAASCVSAILSIDHVLLKDK